MKKYLISLLIPSLLIYLTGCYSMQEVTKEEFSQSHDNPAYLLQTEKKEITYQQGDFYVWHDTIYGKGACKTLDNFEVPFDSSLALNDIDEIQTEKFNLGGTIALGFGIAVIVAGFITLAMASTWSTNFNHL